MKKRVQDLPIVLYHRWQSVAVSTSKINKGKSSKIPSLCIPTKLLPYWRWCAWRIWSGLRRAGTWRQYLIRMRFLLTEMMTDALPNIGAKKLLPILPNCFQQACRRWKQTCQVAYCLLHQCLRQGDMTGASIYPIKPQWSKQVGC